MRKNRILNIILLVLLVTTLSVCFFACGEDPNSKKTEITPINHREFIDQASMYKILKEKLYTFDEMVSNLKARGYEFTVQEFKANDTPYAPIRAFMCSTVYEGTYQFMHCYEFVENEYAHETFMMYHELYPKDKYPGMGMCRYANCFNYGSPIILNDMIKD